VPAGVQDDLLCAPCAINTPCERDIPPLRPFTKTEPTREYQIPEITSVVDPWIDLGRCSQWCFPDDVVDEFFNSVAHQWWNRIVRQLLH
jgi:hypothetical protein